MAEPENGNDSGFFDVPAQEVTKVDSHQQREAAEAAPAKTLLSIYNTDILHEIFEHLSQELEDQETIAKVARKTLLEAACSCSGFLEPAMAAMWRVLSSLAPLLHLLPSITKVNDKLILASVKSEDWQNFDKRAKHVQVLLFRQGLDNISSFTYERLRQLHDLPILPALLKIHIFNDFNVSSSLAPFFSLSSSVRSIELGENALACQEFIRPFIASITTQSPAITRLKICSGSNELDPSLLLELTHLADLDLEVTCGHLSLAFMTGLGRLTTLKTLALRTGSYLPPMESTTASEEPPALDPKFPSFVLSLPHPLFSQLQFLRLQGSPDAILILIAYISPSSLRLLDFQEFGDEVISIRRKNPMLSRFASIAQKLKTFTVKQTLRSTILHLASLRKLHQLVFLEIQGGAVNVTDDDLPVIASNLPYLRKLLLPDICCVNSPTLCFLWTENMLPPILECLRISVFKFGGPLVPFPSLPNTSIPRAKAHRSLRQLYICSHFGARSDADVNRLSKLLNYAFPKLDSVKGYGPYARKESWDRVDLFRASFREVCENLDQEYEDLAASF